MRSNLVVALILALCLSYSCKKGQNSKEIITAPATTVATDEVEISGTVYASDGGSAEGALVEIDGTKIILPASGTYNFKGKVSDPDKVKLTISKSGNFKYTKILTVEEKSTNKVPTYVLNAETVAGSFTSAAGGTVTTTYATLVFQPNSFAKESGDTYNGQVTVKMPSGDFGMFGLPFPGDARGITAANEKVVIESWGGINVQVYDNAGQRLKLIRPMNYTYKADYRFVYINNSKKINIWTYDDADNVWKEAGETKINGQYFTGSTSSLSYLQWGTAYPAALIRAEIKDANANVASFFQFHYRFDNFNVKAFPPVIANADGIALAYIAGGNQMITSILNPCNEVLNANILSFGPLPVTQKTGLLFKVNLTPYITTFEGFIESCDFSGFNGKAEYTFEGRKMTSKVTNGNFKFSFLHCHTSYTSGKLVIYDDQNKIVHQNENYLIEAGAKNRYAASVCTKPQIANITVNVEGKTYTFQTPKDSVQFSSTFDLYGNLATAITAESADKKQSFFLTYLGHKGGTIQILTFGFAIPSKNYLMAWGLYAPGTASITTYKTGNTIAEGTFKTKTGSGDVEVTGNFKMTW